MNRSSIGRIILTIVCATIQKSEAITQIQCMEAGGVWSYGFSKKLGFGKKKGCHCNVKNPIKHPFICSIQDHKSTGQVQLKEVEKAVVLSSDMNRQINKIFSSVRHDQCDWSLVEDFSEDLEGLVEERQSIEVIREAWDPSYFTDPKASVLGKPFRYLIHGVLEQDDRVLQKEVIRKAALRLKYENSMHSEFIDLMKNPERISDKKIISASLINENKRATFAASGFILKVPKGNVRVSSATDMGLLNIFSATMTPNEKVATLEAMEDLYHLDTPDRLLQMTSSSGYNEVAVEGTTVTGKKVAISGIFYKIDQNGKSIPSQKRMEDLLALSRKLHVPLIPISEIERR